MLSVIAKLTSNHCIIKDVDFFQSGRFLHIRFTATTGNAMGMNIIGNSVNAILQHLSSHFNIKIISLSGNCCTDKKPSFTNWILGRGKHVTSEAFIHKDILYKKLNIDYNHLIQLNYNKNIIGSALAGTIGGYNAHSANIISALFLSTGQDIAQLITSSNCLTTFEKDDNYLKITTNLPSLEVGIVGGGTDLDSQNACIKYMNITTSSELASIIGATTLVGELSLMSSLVKNDLIKAHIDLNRKKKII